jgi:transposase-like protein
MINTPCRKCGSINIRKNGLTAAGTQKYHCKACDFYGTLNTQEEKQKKKEELIEKLFCERISQRGIARSVGVSRNRVISMIKKKKFSLSHRALQRPRNVRLSKWTKRGHL